MRDLNRTEFGKTGLPVKVRVVLHGRVVAVLALPLHRAKPPRETAAVAAFRTVCNSSLKSVTAVSPMPQRNATAYSTLPCTIGPPTARMQHHEP